jgi:hypothetical protein
VVKSVPRWVLGVAAAVVVAGAADVALFAFTDRGRAPAQPKLEGVAVIDAAHDRLVGRLTVGHQPTTVMSGFGTAWVLNKSDGTISRIDERQRRVVGTLRMPQPADGLTLGDGALWLTGHGSLVTYTRDNPHGTTTVRRVDPVSGRVQRTLQIDVGGVLIAEGGGAVWSTGFVQGDVRRGARSDAVTGDSHVLDDRVFGDLLAADGTSAYYVTGLGARVQRVDGSTGELLASLNLADVKDLVAGRLPPNPTDVAIGGGSLWLSQTDGTVLQVDPSLRRIERTIKACGNAIAVAYGDDAVWTACTDGTAVRVDPRTGHASQPIQVGGLPRGIAAGGGSVWVTVN